MLYFKSVCQFRKAAFSLHVENISVVQNGIVIELFIQCCVTMHSRVEELSLAIREGELDFSTASFVF